MNRITFSLVCVLLVALLAAAPVIAATVSCPSSCSCLLPADAKKLGYPGYCDSKQAVCGYDAQKNEKYCYAKPVTTTAVPQLIMTAKTVVAATSPAVVPQKCASGCTCLSTADGRRKGLQYCGGGQIVCGYSGSTPLYCFALPPVQTSGTPSGAGAATPAPVTCPATCMCMSDAQAQLAAKPPSACGGTRTYCGSLPDGTTMYCYVAPYPAMVGTVPADGTPPLTTSRPPSDNPLPDISRQPSDGAPVPVSQRPADGPVPGVTGKTTTPVPGGGFVSSINTFFASLFGSSPPPPSSSLQPVPCNGIMTSVMTDPHNCGSCGTECSSGSCVMGQCSGQATRVTACGPLAVQCDGTCTYTRSDESNCGTCGNVCPAGDTCCAGICTTLRTTENCGWCGNHCGTGEACCSGSCTDLSSDRLNCGSCGRPCPGTSVCENGVCIDRTCEEALFAERKANAELQARLDLLSQRYDEMEHRYNYCLWLTDFYKEGCLESLGDHCTTPPDPTEDVPFVTEYEP